MTLIEDGIDNFVPYPAYRAQFAPACPEDIPWIVSKSVKQSTDGDRPEVWETVKEEEGREMGRGMLSSAPLLGSARFRSA